MISKTLNRNTRNRKFQCAGPDDWSQVFEALAVKLEGPGAREAVGIRAALETFVREHGAELGYEPGAWRRELLADPNQLDLPVSSERAALPPQEPVADAATSSASPAARSPSPRCQCKHPLAPTSVCPKCDEALCTRCNFQHHRSCEAIRDIKQKAATKPKAPKAVRIRTEDEFHRLKPKARIRVRADRSTKPTKLRAERTKSSRPSSRNQGAKP